MQLVAFSLAAAAVAVAAALYLPTLVNCPLDPTVGNVERVSALVLAERLRGSRVLVVGATRGIGRGVAFALARAGASVSIVGRSREGGQAVVDAMLSLAPHQSEQEFEAFSADLSLVEGCLNFTRQVKERAGAQFDHVVFTVGAWPDRHQPRTAEGLDKVVALDVLARFVVLREVAPLLRPGARVLSVLASTVHMPFPGVEDIKAFVSGAKKDYWVFQMLLSAGASGDALLQVAASHYPTVRFIGAHPGIVKTDLLVASNTFPTWFSSLATRALKALPMVLTEEESGEILLNILSSPNVNRRPVTYFNHQLEGRNATFQAYDKEFGEWLWSFLETKASGKSGQGGLRADSTL